MLQMHNAIISLRVHACQAVLLSVQPQSHCNPSVLLAQITALHVLQQSPKDIVPVHQQRPKLQAQQQVTAAAV
jgi:hypothetical protein